MLHLPCVLSVFSRQITRLSLLPVLLAGLVLPAAAQVSYTGSAASQNFGSVAIGSPKTVSFSFSVGAGTTVGSIAVVTQGAPNLDFTNAAGTTCTATTYASAATCAVDVTFTPRVAGLRMGAVVFFSGAGNTGTQSASVPVYGVGSGPQIAYGPGTAIAISPTGNGVALGDPFGLAGDGAGDLFIADAHNNRIVEVPAGGRAATAFDPMANGVGLNHPEGLALDGAGDLFIADENNNRVVEVPTGGGAAFAIDPTVNGLALNNPFGLALDGAGDLFITGSPINSVVEVPAGGGPAIAITPMVNGELLDEPGALATDAAGDLFIVDTAHGRVVEVPAGGGSAIAIDPTVNGELVTSPYSLAVDGAGDLFIADNGNRRIVEVPAGGGAATQFNEEGIYVEPMGLAVDSVGDLYYAEPEYGRIIEIERSQPPAVNFPTPTPVGSTDTTDGTQTVQIFNIGTQALDFAAVSYPADFSQASGNASACSNSTSLNAGQECDLPIEFAPENVGSPLNENVTLTDNALNLSGAQQSIAVSGTAAPADALYLPNPGTVLAGPKVNFTWTPAAGATGYSLWIGSTGVGSNNLYDSGERSATSATVAGLPTNGKTLYVRLYTTSGKATVHSDYTYAAATQAALTAPSGSLLAGPNITFTWSAATGIARGYSLWLGSTGPGSDDLYDSGLTTATSVTASGLPTNGETIYTRLYTNFNGALAYSDYTFTAATQALSSITSPTPGTTLTGSTVTFTWTATAGASGYSLWLGSTGAGSYNLYDSHETTETSVTAKGLPANGETIYARLYINFNGVVRYQDYTYTAQ